MSETSGKYFVSGPMIIETQCAYCGAPLITTDKKTLFECGKSSEPVCTDCQKVEPREDDYE